VTEKEKFLAWVKAEQAKGLVSISLTPAWFPGSRPEGVTEEDVYRELNAMNAAVARGDAKPLVDI
jgi:hypothetical protein